VNVLATRSRHVRNVICDLMGALADISSEGALAEMSARSALYLHNRHHLVSQTSRHVPTRTESDVWTGIPLKRTEIDDSDGSHRRLAPGHQIRRNLGRVLHNRKQ